MKQFILLLALSFFVVSVFAQSIFVEPHDKNLSSSDLWSEMITEITVENISSFDTIDIKVSKEILQSTGLSTNYFCWVNCFLSTTITSPTTITFVPGQVDDVNFSVHFNPNGEAGSSAIKYCAFDANNPNDSACTIVYYEAITTSINDEHNAINFSDFHPNPATTVTKMNFNLMPGQKAELEIIDVLGNIVKEQLFVDEMGTASLSVVDLKAGVYFANIKLEGQLHEIKRLVITE